MPDRTEFALRQRIMERAYIEDRGYASPCWISDRAAHPKGYTKITVGKRTWLTHRLAYELFVGAIPPDLQLDHLCRQPACCNPAHLEPVTCRENLVRGDTMIARQVRQTVCVRGHALTPANTYRRRDRPTIRECLRCRNGWRAR